MKILIFCKASTKIGMGHLIRSRTLATAVFEEHPDVQLDFVMVGDFLAKNLLKNTVFPARYFAKEESVELASAYDVAFFDTIHLADELLDRIQQRTVLSISISPIFDHMAKMDILFNRTKYIRPEYEQLPIHKYLGLEYTLIQPNCTKINTVIYEANLQRTNFPIALSMGGGDAPNKTLRFIKSLKRCKIPATFWVMLGEGYGHSYDELIREIKKDSTHEIILAKTNQSMWHILSNCVLAILPGGITSYEAIYAGLPAINIVDSERSYFLIKEPEEKKACFFGGFLEEDTIGALNSKIEHLYAHRAELLAMHRAAQNLIDDRAAARIVQVCRQHLAQANRPTVNG